MVASKIASATGSGVWVRSTALRAWRARHGRLEAAVWRRLVQERLGRWAAYTDVPRGTASYSPHTKTPNDRTRCAIREGFEVRIIGAAYAITACRTASECSASVRVARACNASRCKTGVPCCR